MKNPYAFIAFLIAAALAPLSSNNSAAANASSIAVCFSSCLALACITSPVAVDAGSVAALAPALLNKFGISPPGLKNSEPLAKPSKPKSPAFWNIVLAGSKSPVGAFIALKSPAAPGVVIAPVNAPSPADNKLISPSLPSWDSCPRIFAPPDNNILLPIVLPNIPAVGPNTGANAARYGNAGLISLGIILSNTFDTGLNIFFKNPIFSLYIV